MKMNITEDTFIDLVRTIYNRKDNFSIEGLRHLYNYLKETYPDQNIDVIKLCCTYEEYSELAEYYEVYDDTPDPIITLPSGGFIVIKH